MPDKPLWLDRLPEAVRQLEQADEPWVDRTALESLLGIGRRRAQQLLAPVARRRVGTSLVADRSQLIAHLKRIAAGEDAYFEGQRRQRFWAHLSEARRQWIEAPRVLVEMSDAQIQRIERDDFEGLPEGVELAAGSIVLRFSEPEEALQKLMALAMAISQNRPAFDERVRLPRADSAARMTAAVS
jgi:hypothetical protein